MTLKQLQSFTVHYGSESKTFAYDKRVEMLGFCDELDAKGVIHNITTKYAKIGG